MAKPNHRGANSRKPMPIRTGSHNLKSSDAKTAEHRAERYAGRNQLQEILSQEENLEELDMPGYEPCDIPAHLRPKENRTTCG